MRGLIKTTLVMVLSISLCLMPGDIQGAPVAAANELAFTILHTNDEHSSLTPHSSTTDNVPGTINPSIGGYARLATLIKDIRRENETEKKPVLLLNAGDFMGGTAYSWLIPRGEAPELIIMQKLGYDAVTIGNHEYDYGTDVLAGYLAKAGYPGAHTTTAVVASNTVIGGDQPLEKDGLYKTYHVKVLENGLKVGFFGLIGIDAISVASDYKPFTFEDQVEAAGKAVAGLKAMGADIIIALSHSGVDEDVDLAREVEGIHVIIGGHCHTALHEPVVQGKTIIVQAGAYLEFLGRLELSYSVQSGELRVTNGDKPFLLPVNSSVPEDPEMEKIIRGFTEDVNALVQLKTAGAFTDMFGTIAYSDFSLPNRPGLVETPLGNFVADAMRIVTSRVTGEKVDVAFTANGNIRGTLYPGTTKGSEGRISFYDLTQLISLGVGEDGYAGYPVASFYLTGQELTRALEVAALLAELKGDDYFLQFSGLKYRYNPADTVLFTIPFIDTPLPSTRAVKSAHVYLGDGIQPDGEEQFASLDRKSEQLYHVATDYYILSFLPMAGDMLPQLEIVPKDKQGNPVAFEDFHRFVVYQNHMELKVWQTVVEHAQGMPTDAWGNPRIPDIYMNASGRIVPVNTFPIAGWLLILLLMAMGGIAALVIMKRRKHRR
ncbi:MAG: bifunctional UDP-sugar hydrolase/5'-nucleotidase [Clostridia bacterium]